MFDCFFKAAVFLFSFFLISFSLCQNAAGQSEEEMNVLLMFYRETDLVVSPARQPESSIQMSYGKQNSKDYRSELSGMARSMGYYVFAGRRESQGLRDSRYFDSDSIYAKLNMSVREDAKLNLNIGYSRPHIGLGYFADIV